MLTEAGTKRRASVHVVEGEAGLLAMDPGGIDPLTSSFVEYHAALTEENRTLRRALTDPRILSGIGNAYSDEILHAARLSPVLLTRKLNDEEWASLYEADASDLAGLDRSASHRGGAARFRTRSRRSGPKCPCMAALENPARDAAIRSNVSRYADNETTIAPAARPRASYSPTVPCRGC